MVDLRKDKTTNNRFVPFLEYVPADMMTGIEYCTIMALSKFTFKLPLLFLLSRKAWSSNC
jgi:hypothetical protein